MTKESVKPLSRWEKSFGANEIKFLDSLSLKTKTIERYLESGRKVEKLVFSGNKELLSEYLNSFMKTPIQYTPEVIELEGRFFGYPDCYVRSYINYGELDNGLSKDEQNLLFYWACPGCRVTSKFIPQYRAIYEEAKRLQLCATLTKPKLNQPTRLILAFGLATFILFAGCKLFSTTTNNHLIPLENDADKDYLKDEWEEPFKLNSNRRDTDANGVLDGIQLAQKMYNKIQNPPSCIEVEEIHYRVLIPAQNAENGLIWAV